MQIHKNTVASVKQRDLTPVSHIDLNRATALSLRLMQIHSGGHNLRSLLNQIGVFIVPVICSQIVATPFMKLHTERATECTPKIRQRIARCKRLQKPSDYSREPISLIVRDVEIGAKHRCAREKPRSRMSPPTQRSPGSWRAPLKFHSDTTMNYAWNTTRLRSHQSSQHRKPVSTN